MATAGNCYNLRHLGHVTISKFTPGLGVLQKPLHELYVTYLTPKGPRMPVATRLALTDRGIILTTKGQDSFHSMRDILLWEPVRWAHVQTKDKKIMFAFESMVPDRHHNQEGLFSKLESQYKYLAQLKHDAVLAIALKSGADAKHVEVHAFVCGTDQQVFEVARALWRAEQVFIGQEAKRVGAVTSSTPQGGHDPSKGGGGAQGSSSGPGANQGKAAGRQSARQAKAKKAGEGEITLEELIRLADLALDDPAAKERPTDREQHRGVQRSRTFNDGPPADREAPRDDVRRGSHEGHAQNHQPGSGMKMVPANNQSLNPLPCYENVANSAGQTPRVYENVSKNNSAPSQLGSTQQPETPDHHRVLPEDRRPSAPNNRRASGLPGGAEFPAVEDPAPARPVALVQPRKVPRYKVLPEASAAEGVVLHRAPQNKDEAAGDRGGGGRNIARSMYELNNCVAVAAKPVGSPQGQRKQQSSKIAASELNLAPRKSSNPDPDPGSRKNNPVPESSSSGGGGGSGSGDKNKKRSGERGKKKDAEMEALAMSADLQHPPANTMSAIATNFENALGYFP